MMPNVLFFATVVFVCLSTVLSDQYHPAPHHQAANRRINVQLATERRKRSYSPWSTRSQVQTPQFDSISMWKPPIYQLSRPYYIPIFGAPGRIPIYFPPQPMVVYNMNPRPQTSTNAPPYLPPDPPKPPKNGTMNLGDRFGMDEEEAPIWGIVPPRTPAQSGGSSGGIIPTRAPPPAVPDTPPPLFHKVEDDQGTNSLSMDGERPPQVVRTTTHAPAPAAAAAPPNVGPGPCVWAIVSCCSAVSNQIRYNCFEQRGCVGAFWGASPCESEFAKAAIASALNYYNSK